MSDGLVVASCGFTFSIAWISPVSATITVISRSCSSCVFDIIPPHSFWPMLYSVVSEENLTPSLPVTGNIPTRLDAAGGAAAPAYPRLFHIHRIGQRSYTVNRDLHPVSGLHEAYACGCAGRDQVSRKQCHSSRDVAKQHSDGKDEIRGRTM